MLDIINLGKISPYLAAGINILNKYRSYKNNTLFYLSTADIIVKVGLKHWAEYFLLDKTTFYTKVRFYLKEKLLPDFISPKETLAFVGMLNVDVETCKTIVIDAVVNTMKVYGVDVFAPMPKYGVPFVYVVDGVNKMFASGFYSEGYEAGTSLFGLSFRFTWNADQAELLNVSKMMTSCDYFTSLRGTIKDNVGLLPEVIENVISEDFAVTFYSELSKVLDSEIVVRELSKEEVDLFTHLEQTQADMKWIETGVHSDFIETLKVSTIAYTDVDFLRLDTCRKACDKDRLFLNNYLISQVKIEHERSVSTLERNKVLAENGFETFIHFKEWNDLFVKGFPFDNKEMVTKAELFKIDFGWSI